MNKKRLGYIQLVLFVFLLAFFIIGVLTHQFKPLRVVEGVITIVLFSWLISLQNVVVRGWFKGKGEE